MDTTSRQNYPTLTEYSFKGLTLPCVELPNESGGTTAWIPTKAACQALGFANPSVAQETHVHPSFHLKLVVQTSAGPRCLNFISEQGFYALLMRSKVEVAQDLRTWLYDEVMPSLARGNSYVQEVAA